MSMEDLSLLNVKCLANMQMLLDSLSVSIAKLESIFTPYYFEFQNLLEAEHYIISEEWERGTIYALGYDDDYKQKYLEEVIPEMRLQYTLPFTKKRKKALICFRIEFGYLCDEEQNSIYFQLFEESDGMNVITESFATNLVSLIPSYWKTGIDDNTVYVEFPVDDNLSKCKIAECAGIFKQYILLPIISELKE